MKTSSASPSNNMPISVRPPGEYREKLSRIAAELGKSEPQVITEVLADTLDMIDQGVDVVPKLVRIIRILREHGATYTSPAEAIGERRDKREISFYQDDSIQAGRSSGICCDNPPSTITLPESFKGYADFAVQVCGDSMEGMIHEGDVVAFRKSSVPQDGRIVAALVDGQTMIKLFKAANGTPAQLVSINKAYDPIPCTPTTIIQGIYEGKLRREEIPELARKTAKRKTKSAEKPLF